MTISHSPTAPVVWWWATWNTPLYNGVRRHFPHRSPDGSEQQYTPQNLNHYRKKERRYGAFDDRY